MTAFGLELRRNRSLLVALGVTVGVYGVIMGLLYPILRENDDVMRAYMESFPKELLAAFGMTGLLSDPGVFYNTYVASWLWPVVAGAAGLLAGTRTVAADLDRGFLDLPLATPISRTRYLLASIAAQLVVMAVLAVTATGTLWLAGEAVGAGFEAGRFALAGLLSFAFACAIAGAATLGSVVTLSRGMTSGIVGGGLALMYIASAVGQVADGWAWLTPLSAWGHLPTTAVIDDGYVPAGDLVLFATVAIGCWVLALVSFRQRDLAG